MRELMKDISGTGVDIGHFNNQYKERFGMSIPRQAPASLMKVGLKKSTDIEKTEENKYDDPQPNDIVHDVGVDEKLPGDIDSSEKSQCDAFLKLTPCSVDAQLVQPAKQKIDWSRFVNF
jgi:hypothetical protein